METVLPSLTLEMTAVKFAAALQYHSVCLCSSYIHIILKYTKNGILSMLTYLSHSTWYWGNLPIFLNLGLNDSLTTAYSSYDTPISILRGIWVASNSLLLAARLQ